MFFYIFIFCGQDVFAVVVDMVLFFILFFRVYNFGFTKWERLHIVLLFYLILLLIIHFLQSDFS